MLNGVNQDFRNTSNEIFVGSIGDAIAPDASAASRLHLAVLAASGSAVVYGLDRLRDRDRDRSTSPLRTAWVERNDRALAVGAAVAADRDDDGDLDVLTGHDRVSWFVNERDGLGGDVPFPVEVPISSSGLEILSKIRASDRLGSTPVIILTAKGQDTDRDLAMAGGADDFLTKPFSPKKLIARIKEILGDTT